MSFAMGVVFVTLLGLWGKSGELDIWGCGLGGEDELQVSIRIYGKYSSEEIRQLAVRG
jgi:hypothetical protein